MTRLPLPRILGAVSRIYCVVRNVRAHRPAITGRIAAFCHHYAHSHARRRLSSSLLTPIIAHHRRVRPRTRRYVRVFSTRSPPRIMPLRLGTRTRSIPPGIELPLVLPSQTVPYKRNFPSIYRLSMALRNNSVALA